jgi:anti-sigma B factor antagonist
VEFSLTVALDPPTATLTANGELDIFAAREITRQFGPATAAGCHRLLVDVGGVTFVDASALGVFARATEDLAARDGSLGFVATSAAFRGLCAMAGLDELFELD